METNTEKHPVLNWILTVLNIGLEVVLFIIALGFLMGIYTLLS